MNYGGPEAAPATESGSGPALPSMEHGHVLGDGLCTPCGKAPAAEGPTAREPCLEKHCAVYRARYAAGNAAGKIYGGANVDAKRRSARASSRRRQAKRREAGLCIRCGKRSPVEGGTTCGTLVQQRLFSRRFSVPRGAVSSFYRIVIA